MKQGLLSWSPCPLFLSLPPTSTTINKVPRPITPISATLKSVNEKLLTARERRQLRNERRESKPSYNWREEVEERLIKKPKKRYTSWTEELNLDNLALLGPQWWVVRVSRVSWQDIAERLAKSLARNLPDIEFKMYAPAIQVKRKLKNGSISVKPKPLFPGCIFLRCTMNKQIHDFIRECDGVGGFVGSKVGNTKRQINKPRPVDADDLEAIFKQAKEEQEKADQAFEEEQQGELTPDSEEQKLNSNFASRDNADSIISSKPKSRSKKNSERPTSGPPAGTDDKLLIPGSSVQVVSGAFAGFSGMLRKLDRKMRMATVVFTLFGKETIADLDVREIVVEVN
ncbi:unnamed protein product [Ilex paraguariensis]|uniref:NusG-like N-terminal domain-containing protein n=1 Tax=Ilex paraguariensis TaxID=185542 RepID=A0ABC8QT45_9AQUA